MTEPPSRTDPLARDWSERVGGPLGDHARPHPWLTPVRVVLAVATIVCGLALVQKQPCIATNWSDNSVRYSRMCYSDIPYLYVDRGLAERQWPYPGSDSATAGRYQALEYPVGIAYLAWTAAVLTVPFATGPPESVRENTSTGDFYGLKGMAEEVNRNFVVNAVLLLAAAIAAAWLLVTAQPRRPWDAMGFAAAPTLLFSALVNWDLLAVVCVAGVLWAWSRRRLVLTGVLIGLGAAAKLYPLFLFGAVVVICLRRRDVPAIVRVGVAGLLTWVAVNLPAVLGDKAAWTYFWTFNSRRGPDLGSLWLVISDPNDPISPHVVNVWSWILFSALCVAILVLGLRAPRTPRFAQLAYLVVLAFLLVNKVYSPQYVLWLLPLAVLARPRWRDLLIWQVGELFYFGAVWLYLGQYTASGTSDAPDPVYHLAIVVRVLAELYLATVVVRDVLAPRHDPVRESTVQDTTTASNRVVV